MDYRRYRANGWFIGSGIVEAGCKHVVGQRLKQSGMFWTEAELRRAQPPLRAAFGGRMESRLEPRLPTSRLRLVTFLQRTQPE